MNKTGAHRGRELSIIIADKRNSKQANAWKKKMWIADKISLTFGNTTIRFLTACLYLS